MNEYKKILDEQQKCKGRKSFDEDDIHSSNIEDDDDYDYWPDFGLGVAQDDVQEALSFSTTSTTEGSTAEHIREDSQDDSDDSQDDLWPIELVVGG